MTEVVQPSYLIALNSVADGESWIQLLPRGPSIRGRDGRNWALPDPATVVAAFQAPIPVDVEHATEIKGPKGEEAPAVGWIEALEVRNGAIWGRVEWTERGRELVNGRGYRFLSPVFTHLKEGARNVLELLSAGLTNRPNLTMAALNRAEEEERPVLDKAIPEALGLTADASPASVVAAINRLKDEKATAVNRAEEFDPEKFVPKADHQLALNKVAAFETAAAAQRDKDIEAAVDAAVEAGKVAPASRDYHIAACKASEDGLTSFRAWTEIAPAQVGAATTPAKNAANRARGAHGLSEEEIAVCRATGMTPETFAAAKKEQEA